MKVEEDESRTWSFEFEIIGEGEDYVTLVLGDQGKIDDAIAQFEEDGEDFDANAMDGSEFAQINFVASAEE